MNNDKKQRMFVDVMQVIWHEGEGGIHPESDDDPRMTNAGSTRKSMKVRWTFHELSMDDPFRV